MFDERDPVFEADVLLENLKKLILKARLTNTPVYYIQHNESEGEPLETGTKGWEIHRDVTPKENELVIQKTTPDSFFRTTLYEELQKDGIQHLILAGIQTEYCVDTTCRRAFSLEYKVTLVSDAHGTWNTEDITARQILNHHNRVLRSFASIKQTDEIKFS